MLTNERIMDLLKIDTQNPADNRALRVISCDSIVKDLFVYNLSEIIAEYGIIPNGFEMQLTLCIRKFNEEIASYLKGESDRFNLSLRPTVLSDDMIIAAFNELVNLCTLVSKIANDKNFNFETVINLINFKLDNYTAICEICGLIDISNGIFRSKIISRLLNIKQELINFKDNRLSREFLINEFQEHYDYISSQLMIICQNKLYNEDFLVYVIMFDVRHYKQNRRIKYRLY